MKNEAVRVDTHFINTSDIADDGDKIARRIHMECNEQIEGIRRSGFYQNWDNYQIMQHSLIQVPNGIVSTLTLRLFDNTRLMG